MGHRLDEAKDGERQALYAQGPAPTPRMQEFIENRQDAQNPERKLPPYVGSRDELKK